MSLSDRPVFGLSDSELLTHLDQITAAERALAAARLETIAELCARGIPATRGHAHPSAFLREHLKLHPGAAGQMHRLAKALPGRPETADALTKGAISESQAAVITTATQAIAAEATSDEQTQAAALLVSHAAILAPKELTVCGRRILHHIAPQTAEKRDREDLDAAERTAWQTRAFTITPDGHGRFRLRGSTTAEGAALLHTILDPLTHPRPTTNTSTSQRTPTDHGPADAGPTDRGPADPGPTDGGPADGQPLRPNAFRDPRSAPQRRHDALLEALRLLLSTDTLPDNGGNRPQLAITIPYDLLTQQLGPGLLDTGTTLTPAETRKLACDAAIIPAILNTHSVPLDLGRTRRLITGALRKALILRDKGCTWPGCDRPPQWCQGHHVQPWSHGGETSLTTAIMICEFHHRLLHHNDGWTVHIGPDGHPWFTPPPHLDPQQTPRRNLYHHNN